MTRAPNCLPPRPIVLSPAHALPRGACDCHAHVIGPHTRFPLVEERSYTPPESRLDAYLAMLDATGMDRGVLVQPSIYGTDNALLLEALASHPDRLRGVAVVDSGISSEQVRTLHAAGVRGFRINLLFKGGPGLEALERTATATAPFGWHAQLLIDLRDLPGLVARLLALPVPVVIDHLGHFPSELGIDGPGFRALTSLAEHHEAWVKVSGFYRLASDPGWASVAPIARRLFEIVPERLVWGSDWPHVGLLHDMPATGELLNAMLAWCPDDARLQAVLVDNPARLYGFPTPAADGGGPSR
ncbi:amidohydrolase family protein [Microvirga massiliensis]|uniref:amidohydrolase family protein n=1 Tax=Microvirga massiliensis TaxID=1033741 RepID=UPI00062B91E3|nr:amidohydrolase family protein [Microvirga massiliensis]